MSVKIVECPRDAMQGIHEFIPTEQKIEYINSLLKIGFDTMDFGSFVSPKAIPQLKDTEAVLHGLDLENTNSKLLAIIANRRGAEDACKFEEIDYLGYPFSISETFQLRNTNATIDASLSRVEEIQELSIRHNKTLVLYISMAFGNPYGDPWSPELAAQWTQRLSSDLGIKIIALADTTGVSDAINIKSMFETMIPEFENVEIGAHLHTTREMAHSKVKAAYEAGCRRFDAALKGYGGCPMAEDELVGNLPTEVLLSSLKQLNQPTIDENLLADAMKIATRTFPL